MTAGLGAPHIAIIGGGFSGLAAAWELVRSGARVTVLEQDDDVGALSGSFGSMDIHWRSFTITGLLTTGM